MGKSLVGELVEDLKYGENQRVGAQLFATPGNEDPLAIPTRFIRREGLRRGYINWSDLDEAVETVTRIAAGLDNNGHRVPRIAVGVKHGNASGGALRSDAQAASRRMIDGDTQAIFGGTVVLNFEITEAVANVLLHHRFTEGKRRPLALVAGAAIGSAAIDVLGKKDHSLHILTNTALRNLGAGSLNPVERFRQVRGGFLVQEADKFVPDFSAEEWLETNGAAPPELERDLIVAWGIGSTSTSNTITIVKNGMVIGNAVGQQDRVSAARLAVDKAHRNGHDTQGSVAYSDSFFPFSDGPAVLADAGVGTIFTSSGSINDHLVFKMLEQRNVRVFSAPDAEMRGFHGH
jgi:phosphoribosylaminoimidazolecarboxamide formyltransferase/IMP cyclohydrolase